MRERNMVASFRTASLAKSVLISLLSARVIGQNVSPKGIVGVAPVVELVMLLAWLCKAPVAVVELNRMVRPINWPVAVNELGDVIEDTIAVVVVPPEHVP